MRGDGPNVPELGRWGVLLRKRSHGSHSGSGDVLDSAIAVLMSIRELSAVRAPTSGFIRLLSIVPHSERNLSMKFLIASLSVLAVACVVSWYSVSLVGYACPMLLARRSWRSGRSCRFRCRWLTLGVVTVLRQGADPGAISGRAASVQQSSGVAHQTSTAFAEPVPAAAIVQTPRQGRPRGVLVQPQAFRVRAHLIARKA